MTRNALPGPRVLGRPPSALLLALLALGAALPAAAQVREAEYRVHDRGELWETVRDDGTLGSPEPLNPFLHLPSMDWPGGPEVLTSKDNQRSYHAGAGLWIGARRPGGQLLFDELGPFALVEVGAVEPIVEVENFVEAPGYDPAEAEEVVVAQFTTESGVRVRRTSRAWSFRGLNTFIILDYAVTNTTGETLTDLRVGFPYLLRPSYQDVLVHNGWGDDFNRTDELVDYDAARALVYARDDTPNFDLPNDVGNYWAEANELRTPGYTGVALLGAPEGAGGEAQPSTVFWAQLLNNERRLTSTSTTDEALYAILSGEDTSLQAAPDQRLTPFVLMGVGPYTLAPSASVRITLVQAVNGIPRSRALEGLSAQSRLTAGLDSLRGSVDRARVLYERTEPGQYAVTAVPPPAPPVELFPLPATRNVAVSWPPIDQTWADPLTGARITDYRVFRSERGFIGPYEQVARIRTDSEADFDPDAGVWRFIDDGVGLGFSYHYAVTATDEDGHQSWLTNRNAEAVTVSSTPAPDALNVSVFPNPFRGVSGFPSDAEANTIVFNNLPERATIRLYTASGELIRVLEHDDPDAGQAAWDQLTDARQRTAPGIYFYTVDSPVGTARGTIVIIK